MKLVFLDIDGVLNRHRIYSNGYCGFDPECVENFNKILHAYEDIRIVISSAWRYMLLQHEMKLKGFEYLMLVGGVDCKDRLIGHTKSDEEIPTRGQQILEWRYQHIMESPRYIILDDMPFDFKQRGLNHFLTIGGRGLTAQDAEKIIQLLH
jgi:hypothetical protein